MVVAEPDRPIHVGDDGRQLHGLEHLAEPPLRLALRHLGFLLRRDVEHHAQIERPRAVGAGNGRRAVAHPAHLPVRPDDTELRLEPRALRSVVVVAADDAIAIVRVQRLLPVLQPLARRHARQLLDLRAGVALLMVEAVDVGHGRQSLHERPPPALGAAKRVDDIDLRGDVEDHALPAGGQGVIFDVTSQVDVVNALRSAESRWRALVERLPAVTYIDGLDHEQSYASPQIEELTGMTPGQWLEDWEEALHPDDRDRVVGSYHHHAAEGTGLEAEFRVVRPDGKVSWVSDRAAPVPSSDGTRTLYLGVMLDITAQKEAEMAERESERRFREMLETVQLAAVITDVDGTIRFG